MKITKRQLRRIIKEEKANMLREQPISGEQAIQMQSAQDTSAQLGLINDAVSALLNAGMNPEELGWRTLQYRRLCNRFRCFSARL